MEGSVSPERPILEKKKVLSESEKRLGPNPIDLSEKPIKKESVFDVRFETPQNLKIQTVDLVPHSVYICDGEKQIASAKLTEDDKFIKEFYIDADASMIKKVLEENPEFPFRQQLIKSSESIVSGKPFEFNPSTEEVTQLKKIFDETFSSANVVVVSRDLIRRILKDDQAAGLHFRELTKKGHSVDLNEVRNTALGWFLEKGCNWKQAEKYASQVVVKKNLCLSEEDTGKLKGKRLGYHEMLHHFLEGVRQSKQQNLINIEEKIKGSYLSIPFQERFDFEQIMDIYQPQEYPEEFWTYYLSTLIYPLDESEKNTAAEINTQKILNLGKNPNIKAVVDKLPFLTDREKAETKVDDLIGKATHIGV